MATLITTPFPVFTDTDGLPLEGGYINVGVAGLNPLSNPIQVYWDQALTMPATNIRTTRGYPSRNGSAAFLYAPPGDFSILIRNKNGVVVLSNLNVIDNVTVVQNDLININAQIATLFQFATEQNHYLGEIFPLSDLRSPTEYNSASPESYFPALCLTNFDTYTDISAANWPLAIDYLRGLKVKFKDGLAGEIASPGVTNWAIAANVATLTFTNDADHIAMLASLLEDQVQHGGYANWRTVTVNSAIGDIPAGTYAITNVNASTRTVSFPLVTADNAGAVAANVDFFAHRIAGSTTTARVFSARGLTIHGANDENGYFVAGGLRRRGYMQGHLHTAYGGTMAGSAGAGYRTPSPTSGSGDVSISGPITDGTNGTPRTGKETHGPALTVHLYMHLGRYTA